MIGQFSLEHPWLFTLIGSVLIAILIHIYCYIHRIRLEGSNKMSGGSMNYFYSTLEEYEKSLGDRELNDLVHDLVKVFHDKEWADSGDISEGTYNKTVKEFKDKWCTPVGGIIRYQSYIDNAVAELRRELRLDGTFCKDCEFWHQDARLNDYGKCDYEKHCLVHGYERPCREFEERE